MKYHKHDKEWVASQLKLISSQKHRMAALDGYKAVYDEAYNNEPITHKKSNAARKAANTRLRLYVDRLLELRNG